MIKKQITLLMSVEDAEYFSSGISDMLCWTRGYCSGERNVENYPLGIEQLRSLNMEIKSAISKVEKDDLEKDELVSALRGLFYASMYRDHPEESERAKRLLDKMEGLQC